MGLLGTRWYLQHPVFPLEETVANLNVEMLGRPGPAYGREGKGWLTGYERFAMEGIPAHTLSSSDFHEDYHTPDDEVDRIDFGSMTQVVETLIDAVRLFADGETPVWKEGGRPEPRGGGR